MLTAGIDAHRRFSAACVLDEDGTMIKETSIRGGVEEAAAWVGALGSPSRVCCEGSLGYGELHDALNGVGADGVGMEVRVAHPGRRRAIFRSRTKDARTLGTALFLDRAPVTHGAGARHCVPGSLGTARGFEGEHRGRA